MSDQNIAWKKETHLQPKRIEQHFLRGLFVRLTRDHFNQARSNIKSRIVI